MKNNIISPASKIPLPAKLFLIVVLTLVVYIPAMRAGFVWDDDLYVTENPLLSAPDGLYRIWFTTDSPSQYFPLVYTTFRTEYSLWGLKPFGYHFNNILLHTINTLLLWLLLSRLNVPATWFAAAVFALHPVQVESVAWITERKNVLMGLFFILSLLAWLSFANRSHQNRTSRHFYLLSLLLCALSLLSKTTACTLPAALVLVLWLKKIPLNAKRWLQIVPFVLLSLAMGLLTIWWEQHHQGTRWARVELSLIERFLIAGRALWFYLGKLLWPANLAFSYPKWNIDPTNPLQYIWLVMCLTAAWCMWQWRKKIGPGFIAAVIFYVAALLPMLGFISLYTFVYTYVADHYQYLAAIGPFALVSALAYKAVLRFGKYQKLILKIAPALILVILGTLTFRQCYAYENAQTLWQDVLRKNPNSFMAHNNLGNIFKTQGKLDDAVSHYTQALNIKPDDEKAHNNLAIVLSKQGQLDLAINHFRYALRLKPNGPLPLSNIARILAEHPDPNKRNTVQAVALAERAAELTKYRNPIVLDALAACYAATGQFDKAANTAQNALELALSTKKNELADHIRKKLQSYRQLKP